jgi:isocitrate dehydrogenase
MVKESVTIIYKVYIKLKLMTPIMQTFRSATCTINIIMEI